MTLKQEFTDFLKKHGISQAKAADGMGYSSSVVSTWLGDTYKGDVQGVELAIRQWLDRETSRRSRKNIPLASTETFLKVTKAITIAHENKVIALVVGDAGVGKTTALRTYAQENPNNTILLSYTNAMTKQTLIELLATSLGLEPKGSIPAVAMRISKLLVERDMVVMIDEADYLKDEALELLRQVVNDNGQTGLVLCGLPRLAQRIKHMPNDHQQIASRVGIYANLGGLKESDVRTILLTIWPGLEKSRDTIGAFWKACQASSRSLSFLIENSHQTCLINNLELPTVEVVTAASVYLLK